MFFWGIVCKTKRKTASPAGPVCPCPSLRLAEAVVLQEAWGRMGQEGRAAAAPTGSEGLSFPQRERRGKSFLPLSFPPPHLMVVSFWWGNQMLTLSTILWTGISWAEEEAHMSLLPRCPAQSQVG